MPYVSVLVSGARVMRSCRLSEATPTFDRTTSPSTHPATEQGLEQKDLAACDARLAETRAHPGEEMPEA